MNIEGFYADEESAGLNFEFCTDTIKLYQLKILRRWKEGDYPFCI
jgi:hypothetical protein